MPVTGLNRRLFKGWLLSLSAPGTNAVAINAAVLPQMSPSTFNTYYEGAKCFLAFALDREIDDLPFTAIPRALAQIPVHKLLSHIKAEVGGKRKRVDPFRRKNPAASAPKKRLSAEQVAMIVSACRNKRDRAFVVTLYGSGMRLGEALGLLMEDLELGEGVIAVTPRIHANGARVKNSKGRQIPVEPLVMEYIEDWVSSKEYPFGTGTNYVFCNLDDGRPLTSDAATSLRRHLIRRTGIDFDWHHLRHTHASECLASGHGLLPTSLRLGHSDPSVTARTYVHLLDEEEKAMRQKMLSSKNLFR